MRKLSYAIGLFQSASLAIYAISLFIEANKIQSKVGSPIVETIIYLVFAVLIFVCASGINQSKSWAKTPYLLAQVFGLVVAYTLFAGSATIYKGLGAAIGAL